MFQPPIYKIIDEYATWKHGIHPYVAGAHRSLLIRLCRSRNIRRVEDITPELIDFFVGSELSEYYAIQAVKCLRSFLWYCRKAGYNSIAHNVSGTVRREGFKKTLATKYEPNKIATSAPPWIQTKRKWGGQGI